MSKIQLTWQEESEKKYIKCDLITEKIEINVSEKELKNVKKFFQEIIYTIFVSNDIEEIELQQSEIEISEVKNIVVEIIELCNEKIKVGLQKSQE